MKLHKSDKITALLGIGLLLILVSASYFYAIQTNVDFLRTRPNDESPDFIAHGLAVTQFEPLGQAKRRLFADYAEHFSDGRMSSIHPKVVTLIPNEPQVKASADTGLSMDNGETFLFTGNVLVTRAGDVNHAPMRFSTTHVTLFPDDNRLETDAPVRLENGSDITTGNGMMLDNVDRTVDIHKNVKTLLMPKQKTL